MFERLEGRVLLDGSLPEGWTFLPAEDAYGVDEFVWGISDNGRYLWSFTTLLTDGVPEAFGEDVSIIEVNNHGDILYWGSGQQGLRLRDASGDHAILDLIDTVVGKEAPGILEPLGLGDGGHVLLRSNSGGPADYWVLHDGVLHFLWTQIPGDGADIDVNASGLVVGGRYTWTESGGVQEATWSSSSGSGTPRDLSGVTDDGAMLDLDQKVRLLQNGTELYSREGWTPTIGAVNNNHEVVWTEFLPDSRDDPQIRVVYADASSDDLLEFVLATAETYDEIHPSVFDISDDGRILVGNGLLIRNALLESGSDDDNRVQSTGAVWVTNEGVHVDAGSSLGRHVVVSEDGARTPGIDSGFSMAYRGASASWTRGGETLRWIFLEGAEGTDEAHLVDIEGVSRFATVEPAITVLAEATVLESFVTPDGRAHVAGVVEHRIHHLFEDGSGGWTVESFDAPDDVELTGSVGAWTASWGAMHLATLDADGDVWASWWAPGMETWGHANLSQIAGAPTLTGSLAVVVTPWDGFHVTGTDPTGAVQSLWWAPESDGWHTADLRAASGVTSRFEGTTGFITPWNGLSFFALDEAGDVAVLWWSPESGVWTASDLTSVLDSSFERPASIRSVVTAAGDQVIAGRSDSGHVSILRWSLDTLEWDATTVR